MTYLNKTNSLPVSLPEVGRKVRAIIKLRSVLETVEEVLIRFGEDDIVWRICDGDGDAYIELNEMTCDVIYWEYV